MATKTAKLTIEADLDLVEAIIQAIHPVLDIADAGRNNRLALNPDKVRRTLRAGLLPQSAGLPPLDAADVAKQTGAEGVWLIRGAKNARLIYTPEDEIIQPEIPIIHTSLSLAFNIADAPVLLIARFPQDDGDPHGPGIESR